MKFYLAYGSNLNTDQMKHRCPYAEMLGVSTIPGKLVFRSVASVEPSSTGGTVPVGVWAISSIDEHNLDVYEGYPHLYRKEYVEFEMDGEVYEGLVYIMNPVRDYAPPSEPYLRTICEGYADFGFPTDDLMNTARSFGYARHSRFRVRR